MQIELIKEYITEQKLFTHIFGANLRNQLKTRRVLLFHYICCRFAKLRLFYGKQKYNSGIDAEPMCQGGKVTVDECKEKIANKSTLTETLVADRLVTAHGRVSRA